LVLFLHRHPTIYFPLFDRHFGRKTGLLRSIVQYFTNTSCYEAIPG
jgi:hypothetical protein